MIHTIEEAKKKYCPVIGGRNECVGDGCMMWRWQLKGTTHKEEKVVTSMSESPQHKIVWVDVVDASTHGYCGMAGKPEVNKK